MAAILERLDSLVEQLRITNQRMDVLNPIAAPPEDNESPRRRSSGDEPEDEGRSSAQDRRSGESTPTLSRLRRDFQQFQYAYFPCPNSCACFTLQHVALHSPRFLTFIVYMIAQPCLRVPYFTECLFAPLCPILLCVSFCLLSMSCVGLPALLCAVQLCTAHIAHHFLCLHACFPACPILPCSAFLHFASPMSPCAHVPCPVCLFLLSTLPRLC